MRFRTTVKMPPELLAEVRALAEFMDTGQPLELREYLARWISRDGYMMIEFDTDGGAPRGVWNLEPPESFDQLRKRMRP